MYRSAMSVDKSDWLSAGGLNLLSFYKVDYACWQVLKYSQGVSRVQCAQSLSHTHKSKQINTNT